MKNLLSLIFVYLFSSSFLFSQASYSPSPVSALGAYAISMGGAIGADVFAGADAIKVNPSIAASQKFYLLTAEYLSQGEGVKGSVVDSRTGPIGAALMYEQQSIDSSDLGMTALGNFSRKTVEYSGGIFSKSSEKFYWGLTGRYSQRKETTSAVLNDKDWNAGVGLTYSASSVFKLGASLQNILSRESALHLRTLNLALSYVLKSVFQINAQFDRYFPNSLKGALLLPSTQAEYAYSVGAQYLYKNMWALRGGYRDMKAFKNSFWSAGVGYKNPKLSLNYAYQKELKLNKEAQHLFQLVVKM